MEKKRSLTIDLFRFIAVILVIMIHTFTRNPIQHMASHSWIYGGGTILANTIGRYAVPIFMLITSYFYFLNPTSQRKKSTLKNLFWLWFVWLIIYLPVGIPSLKNASLHGLVHILIYTVIGRSVFYVGSWYLVALFWGIIFVDFFRKRRMMWINVLCSVIFLVLGSLNSTYYKISKFHLMAPGNISCAVTTGIIWVTLGYYIVKYRERVKCFNKFRYVILAVLLTVLEYILVIWLSPNHVPVIYTDLYFTLPLSVTFIFGYMINNPLSTERNKVIFIRDLSTLMYFVQFGMIDIFANVLPAAFMPFGIILLTLGVSVIIIFISKLKYAKVFQLLYRSRL